MAWTSTAPPTTAHQVQMLMTPTALERQDLSRTYLAHHELESVVIIITVIIIIINTDF